MIKRIGWLAVVLGVILGGVAAAQQQHPILDMLAAKVIDKYSQSTCEQLWEARGKPKSAQEQEMVTFLRGNPPMRAEFLNKIAAPVANKMFECGMIP